MMRALILGLFLCLTAGRAQAEAGGDYPRCMFEMLWQQAEKLETVKRERLVPVFLEAVAEAADADLLAEWEQRAGRVYAPPPVYEDYALRKVSQFIAEAGWPAFFERAQSRAYPLNSGRPEMMAAAAAHLADAPTAERIYTLMERLAAEDRSKAAFERASFGHVLAEAAMQRCELARFDRAVTLTDDRDNIRYAFWRTRMSGETSALMARLSQEFDPENATYLRQAIDGYADTLRLGPCKNIVE